MPPCSCWVWAVAVWAAVDRGQLAYSPGPWFGGLANQQGTPAACLPACLPACGSAGLSRTFVLGVSDAPDYVCCGPRCRDALRAVVMLCRSADMDAARLGLQVGSSLVFWSGLV